MAERDELARLVRMAKYKGAPPAKGVLVGEDMAAFFRQVDRRRPRLQALGRAWEGLVPELFLRHTCLETFSGGTLTVLVDSGTHLYELKQLLMAGLEKQLVVACKSAGLRKVVLKKGQWYDGKTGAPKF